MSRLAQSSLEYLIVMAFTLAILVPAVYLFYNTSRESNEQIADSQINAIGASIVDNVKYVYYSGKGSKITLELNIPKGVENVYVIGGKELVFKSSRGIGIVEMVYFSNIVDMYTSKCDPIDTSTNIQVCRLFDEAEEIFGLTKLKIESIEDNKVHLSKI